MSRKVESFSYSLNNYKLIRNRELGLKPKLGHDTDISKKIYSNLNVSPPDVPLEKFKSEQGGIFNLEFSLDGRMLVSACKERCVLIFDAANQKLIRKINEAHCNCVNCVRFLNDHTFATCSDDNTIKVWDTRMLNSATRTLQGHSNWVKNIEYSEKENVMVTSAFDGSIYAWDLKSPTENNVLYDKVFVMNGLMRTKLSPDGTKMVICTTSGYIIIIHDLNLRTLSTDMKTFKPNLYRLMQLSEQTFPAATMFNYLFFHSRKTNRLEFIDDFPNDVEVISSLQIHPMGWNALSRSINGSENEEWTAVHDIQSRDSAEYEESFHYVLDSAFSDINAEDSPPEDVDNARPTDIWMGFITNEQLSAQRSQRNQNSQESIHSSMGIIHSGLVGRDNYMRYFRKRPEDRFRIVKNLPRLTHFVKEQSVGKGYIKELCYSSDGRIICSPYGKGVRLLAFDENMQEVCYCVPDKPRELYTVAEMNDYHSDVVVCCKFSPRHYQLVSGCLGGEINWYHPVL